MAITRDFSLDAKYRQEEGSDLPVGHPGAGPSAARPAPRRRAPRPQHRHDDLRLPRLAAGRARPHPRAQPADLLRRAQRASSSPGSTKTSARPPSTAASSPTSSRSRSTTACSACGTARARASTAPATSSSTPTSPASRSNGGVLALGGDDPLSKSSTLPIALRGGLLRRAVPGALPGQRRRRSSTSAGWASSCRATRACGSGSRSSPTSPTRSAPPRSRPDRVVIVDPGFDYEGRPWQATRRTRCCCRPSASRWSGRSTTAAWRRPRPSPPPTGSTASRVHTPERLARHRRRRQDVLRPARGAPRARARRRGAPAATASAS